jgi:hypothetical protein
MVGWKRDWMEVNGWTRSELTYVSWKYLGLDWNGLFSVGLGGRDGWAWWMIMVLLGGWMCIPLA